jgi:hypothetical protein
MKTIPLLLAVTLLAACKDKDQAADWTKAPSFEVQSKTVAAVDEEVLQAGDEFLSLMRIEREARADAERWKAAGEDATAAWNRFTEINLAKGDKGREHLAKFRAHRERVSRLGVEQERARSAGGDQAKVTSAEREYLESLALSAADILRAAN